MLGIVGGNLLVVFFPKELKGAPKRLVELDQTGELSIRANQDPLVLWGGHYLGGILKKS